MPASWAHRSPPTANAGVPVTLFDLAAKEGDRNGIVKKALTGLKKLEPAPLAGVARLALIQPANYDDHIERLQGCDLIIEAIAERMDWKTALYERIAPHVAPGAIIASNTSGLSIDALGHALPEQLRHRFCGIHFSTRRATCGWSRSSPPRTPNRACWTSSKPGSRRRWARA